ncbi:MAG: DUF1501 domain-containing protein [Acidobacteria bacterium]|nr:DUF1501 domain-containing protein [Acidobacteriota bacterium]
MHTFNRRQFLEKSALGFGGLAASTLMAQPKNKGKSVIFLFMHGGPSHLDTFDPKPLLKKLHGQPVPPSFGKADFQFTKVDKVPIMASPLEFKPRGQSGVPISSLFENLSRHADDLAVIRSCHHDGFTHVTGQNWMNTGWARVGRPSVGSWVVYGLGSESDNLPAYVVMLDGGIKAGAPAYGSGFLPASFQGTVLRTEGPPILNVNRPEGVSEKMQRETFDLLRFYNERHHSERAEDTELEARMNSYELAFKMQMAVPEVADLTKETTATRELYGLNDPLTSEFGSQCLMARRLVERGVRFVQLYSGGKKGSEVGWDAHNECDQNHTFMASKVDKPIAGLLADLKSRGLLDNTVLLWGGDFGRTPFTDGAEGGGGSRNGRDHNPYGFSVWMAGGGIKGGKIIGATDDIGLRATEDKVTMHDLHATLLGLLGVDHKKLTFQFQGRDFRLTDVGGDNNLTARLTAG